MSTLTSKAVGKQSTRRCFTIQNIVNVALLDEVLGDDRSGEIHLNKCVTIADLAFPVFITNPTLLPQLPRCSY